MTTRSSRSTVMVSFLVFLAIACASTAHRSSPNAVPCAGEAEPTALKIEPGSEIVPPKPLHRVEPIASASLRGRSAVATINAVIGEDGRPRHTCITDGDPEWGRAVEAAFRQWLFEPATLHGKPVAVRFTLTTRWRS